MFKSSNPALKSDIYTKLSQYTTDAGPMTLSGTINKTSLLLLLVLGSGVLGWQVANPAVIIAGGLIGLVIGIATAMKQTWSPITAPAYAICQGITLGALSSVFEALYSGIVIQAIGLTIATLFTLLGAYQSGLIKVTEKFKLGVVAATGGVFAVYMLQFVLRLFGIQLFSTGPVGIIISLVIVCIAALNLVLDFDFIETGVAQQAPGYMEWYSGFGLLVTLLWLYVEILNLLARLRQQD